MRLMAGNNSIFVASLIFFIGSAANAGWKLETQKDDMTDKKSRFAYVDNKDSSLFIYEDNSGKVMGGFSLKKFEQIHYEPKVITIRVDENRATSIQYTAWEPNRIFFSIGTSLIDEIVSGKIIKVQYPSSRYGTKIQTFSGAGALTTIRSALPSYRTKHEREQEEAMAAKDRADLESGKIDQQELFEKKEREKQERYSKECPDVWTDFQNLKTNTGRPQLWQGCSANYK